MTRSAYPTLKEIRNAHTWKREYEKYLPLSRFVFRPIGFLLTWLAIRIGLTTEEVSWLSGLAGLIAYICLMSGQEGLLLIGIGFLYIFNLLDCVDGCIARTMKTENPYGKFLDISMGWIDMGFWAVIGTMVYRHPKFLCYSDPFSYGTIFWLAVGGLTCYFSNLFKYIEGTFDKCMRNDWNNIKTKKNRDLMDKPENGKIKEVSHSKANLSPVMAIIRKLNHNLRVRETTYFFLLLAYLCRVIDFLLIAYLFYYFMHTVILVIIYSIRGRQLLRFYKQEW